MSRHVQNIVLDLELEQVMSDQSEAHASFTIGDKFSALLALKERLENG